MQDGLGHLVRVRIMQYLKRESPGVEGELNGLIK